jgi:hypothetical protein
MALAERPACRRLLIARLKPSRYSKAGRHEEMQRSTTAADAE